MTRLVMDGVREVLSDVFGRDDLHVTEATSAADIPGWDSMKQIEVVVAVETRFGVKLRTREIDAMQTVGDLARTVAAKLPHA